MLSPAAIAVLTKLKSRLEGKRDTAEREVLQLSIEQMAEVNRAHREMEAKAYANWAAKRLVEMLRGNGLNATNELYVAEPWYRKKLRRGYLVAPEWLEHSYQAAVRLAKG